MRRSRTARRATATSWPTSPRQFLKTCAPTGSATSADSAGHSDRGDGEGPGSYGSFASLRMTNALSPGAVENLEEGVDDLRIEEFAPPLLQHFKSLHNRLARMVGPSLGHGVKRIRNRHDARGDRDVI